MPRFVVLEHAQSAGRHWDFMLESGDTLATWSLATPPTMPGKQSALALADHRLTYLDYEGPVSGDRGNVMRWDAGSYELMEKAGGRWRVLLSGRQLRGLALLTQTAADQWTIEFTPTAEQ